MRAQLIRRLGAAGLGLALVAGCGGAGGAGEPGALAVIVGAHSNMVVPSLTAAVRDEIDTASSLGSPATVIVPDGSPTVSATIDLATHPATGTFTAGSAPDGVAVTPDGRTAYVADAGVKTIVEEGDHHIVVGEVIDAHLRHPPAGRPDAAILEMKDLGDNVFYGG